MYTRLLGELVTQQSKTANFNGGSSQLIKLLFSKNIRLFRTKIETRVMCSQEEALKLLMVPDLKDGKILGLYLPCKGSLIIHTQTRQGDRYDLELTGLRRLRCDMFLEENDIYSIEILHKTEPRPESLFPIAGEPPAREPYRSRHQDWIGELSKAILEGALTLVCIEPSYGCALTALCERLRVGPITPTANSGETAIQAIGSPSGRRRI
jgi:hypothetical protein